MLTALREHENVRKAMLTQSREHATLAPRKRLEMSLLPLGEQVAEGRMRGTMKGERRS